MSDGRSSSALVMRSLSTLRHNGLRATAARRVVLEVLASEAAPLTVSRLASGLDGRYPCTDLGSVYRILDTFERVGIVRRVRLGGGPALFVLRVDDDHEYLLCEACGSARAVNPRLLDDVRRLIHARFGLEASFASYPVAGLCRTCRHENHNRSECRPWASTIPSTSPSSS